MPEETVVVEEEVQQEEAPVEGPNPNAILEEEPQVDLTPPSEETVSEPEPVVEAQAESNPAVDFRNDQYALGANYGLTPEQVRSFGTTENFDQVFSNASIHHQQAPPQQPQSQQQQLAQQPIGNFALPNVDDYDEHIVNMNTHMNVRMMQMEAMLAAMHNQQQRLQADSAGRELEGVLDSSEESIFGRGNLNSLSESQARNRVAIANEISRDGHGYVQRGEQVPSLEKMAQKAIASLFSDQLKTQALQSASDKSRRVAGQSTARPTQQEESPVSGQEAAIRAAAEWHRENGTFTGHDQFG